MPNLDTGPYGAFIWPAYALTALVLGWMVAATLISARRWKQRAEGTGRGERPERPELRERL